MRIDVSGLQPAAQLIVQQAAATYVHHLQPGLVSLVAHGSAVKGGYIQGGSDLDLALFLAPGLLDARAAIPLERAAALHKDLAKIDPWPFRYLQAYPYQRDQAPGPGFVPGAYHVVCGDPQVPLATAESLVQDAHSSLAALDPDTVNARVSRKLLQHGEDRLYRELRLLATEVWSTLYDVLTLQPGADPQATWCLPKPDAVACTNPTSLLGRSIRGFFTNIRRHYAAPPERVSTALMALPPGLTFLSAAADWYRGR